MMFDHAVVSSQFVPLFGCLVAFFCQHHFGVDLIVFSISDTCLRLH